MSYLSQYYLFFGQLISNLSIYYVLTNKQLISIGYFGLMEIGLVWVTLS